MAAFGFSNTKSSLDALYRRQRARLEPPKVITATAHKLARIFYSMLKNGAAYINQGQDNYDKNYRNRSTKNPKKTGSSGI